MIYKSGTLRNELLHFLRHNYLHIMRQKYEAELHKYIHYTIQKLNSYIINKKMGNSRQGEASIDRKILAKKLKEMVENI